MPIYTHINIIYMHICICVCYLKIIAHDFCITFTFLLEMLAGTVEPLFSFYFKNCFLLWKISNICQNGKNSIATFYIPIILLQHLRIHNQSCFFHTLIQSLQSYDFEINLKHHIIPCLAFVRPRTC